MSNDENDANESRYETNNVFHATVNIKAHKGEKISNDIPDTYINPDLFYNAKEIEYNPGEYKLLFHFNKNVTISRHDISEHNLNNPKKHFSSSSDKDVKDWFFFYNDLSFSLELTISIPIGKSSSPEFTDIPSDYNAGMVTSLESNYNDMKIKDYSRLNSVRGDISIKNCFTEDKTLSSLIKPIFERSQIQRKDCQIFFEECNQMVGEIYNIKKKKIFETEPINFLNINIIGPEDETEYAYIRCQIIINQRRNPYVLPIAHKTNINQIFQCIRNILSECSEMTVISGMNIKSLRIKLCYKNYKIQLKETDTQSTLKKVAESIIYPFEKYDDCKDLLLKVKSIIN